MNFIALMFLVAVFVFIYSLTKGARARAAQTGKSRNLTRTRWISALLSFALFFCNRLARGKHPAGNPCGTTQHRNDGQCGHGAARFRAGYPEQYAGTGTAAGWLGPARARQRGTGCRCTRPFGKRTDTGYPSRRPKPGAFTGAHPQREQRRRGCGGSTSRLKPGALVCARPQHKQRWRRCYGVDPAVWQQVPFPKQLQQHEKPNAGNPGPCHSTGLYTL